MDSPIDLKDKTAPYPDVEIDQMLEDLTEIKHLLFCRLLLSHDNVLPAAIRANSVEEFLNNSEVRHRTERYCAENGQPGTPGDP